MTNFGKYDLLERIASGGMAELFLARQTGVGGFSKTVVIKRIHKHLSADYEFTTMFINEARVSAQLSHQNIVQVYDFGEHEGSYFIGMEYVFGQDLKSAYKLCRKKRIHMPLPLAIYIVQQMCKGLDYAHRKKDGKGRPLDIVHRDVSPQNILIWYEGEVKVADFGIAKAASSSRMTQAGTLKGKIAYMSPEQAWGKTVDRRSDIFSIGIVFWEILTNQRLFFGNSDFETLERVRNCEVPDITGVVPSISKEIDRILRKSLAKEADARYQSAAEMNHDLEVFSAAHGFYNQSPELANFLRSHFLEGEESDDLSSQSGSHPRVLTADGVLSEAHEPIESIDRNESNRRAPSPGGLPPVAQQVVAQARDATRPPPTPARPMQEEDDTYQAPPLSQSFFDESESASRSATPASKAERSGSTEARAGRQRAEAPREGTPAKGEPPKRSTQKMAAASAALAQDKTADEAKPTTKRAAAAPVKKKSRPAPPVEEEELEDESVDDEDEAGDEEWDDEDEWEEVEAPRSSALVLVLAIFLVVAIGAVGGIGLYLVRQKGVLLPASWLPPGRMVIQTASGAQVFLAGEAKGTTDASGKLTVSAIGGSHDVKISKSGYADWTSTVKVRPNRPVPVPATLEALRGQLVVTANEPGVRLYVDGVYYGRTPATATAGKYRKVLDHIPAGDHVIVAAKSGRREVEKKLNVTPGKEAPADFVMTPATVQSVDVTVETNQKGAFAILDGEYKDTLAPGKPLQLKLEQGIHELTVLQLNFNPVVFRVRDWSKSKRLNAELKPAKETGTLHVITTTEAYDLLVDGREILRSTDEAKLKVEVNLPGIPQGKHTVQIVHPSFGSETQEVQVDGKVTTVRFGQTTSVRLDTTPDKATVLMNGAFQGVSDLRLAVPKAGSFKLEITLPGYKPYKKTYQAAEVKDPLEIGLEKE